MYVDMNELISSIPKIEGELNTIIAVICALIPVIFGLPIYTKYSNRKIRDEIKNLNMLNYMYMKFIELNMLLTNDGIGNMSAQLIANRIDEISYILYSNSKEIGVEKTCLFICQLLEGTSICYKNSIAINKVDIEKIAKFVQKNKDELDLSYSEIFDYCYMSYINRNYRDNYRRKIDEYVKITSLQERSRYTKEIFIKYFELDFYNNHKKYLNLIIRDYLDINVITSQIEFEEKIEYSSTKQQLLKHFNEVNK